MKKIIFTLGFLAGISALTIAQDTHSSTDGHGHDAPAASTSLADIKMDKLIHDAVICAQVDLERLPPSGGVATNGAGESVFARGRGA